MRPCVRYLLCRLGFLLFFNDTATPEIYTLSLHDALPICPSPTILMGNRPPIRCQAETRVVIPFSGESRPMYRANLPCPRPRPGSSARQLGFTMILSSGRPPATNLLRANSDKAM